MFFWGKSLLYRFSSIYHFECFLHWHSLFSLYLIIYSAPLFSSVFWWTSTNLLGYLLIYEHLISCCVLSASYFSHFMERNILFECVDFSFSMHKTHLTLFNYYHRLASSTSSKRNENTKKNVWFICLLLIPFTFNIWLDNNFLVYYLFIYISNKQKMRRRKKKPRWNFKWEFSVLWYFYFKSVENVNKQKGKKSNISNVSSISFHQLVSAFLVCTNHIYCIY